MVTMPSSDEIKKAYQGSISRVPQRYADKVKKVTGFVEKAKAGESLYAQKMQEAIANRSREKGLNNITDADWQNAALNKGAARIGPGMSAAVDKQVQGYEPYRQALASVELPARTADPMANVQNRVGGVVKVMVETKRAQLG